MISNKGRPKAPQGLEKLHLSIPADLVSRLQEIQKQSGASSIADVVKDALRLYAAAVEEHSNGGKVYFKRHNEEGERQLVIFL